MNLISLLKYKSYFPYVVILGLAGYIYFKPTNIKIVPVQTTPEVQTFYVDKPVLSEKIITKVLPDPKDKAAIESLLAENQRLSSKVVELTQTIADVSSHGEGPVEVPTPAPISVHFKDWRLDFTSDGQKAQYSLSQKFEILSTSGRDKEGKTISLVKLFELGPNGERVPANNLKTTAIIADQTTPHLLISPSVQAGFMISLTDKGGIVGLQWLKRGRTPAAEDSTISFATPVVFLTKTVKEAGLLPISINLGQLPHNPLKDVWISPYVGFSLTSTTPKRVGLAITATF